VNLTIGVAFLAEVPIVTVATHKERPGDLFDATMVANAIMIARCRWILRPAIAWAGALLVRQTTAVATVLLDSTAESLSFDLVALFATTKVVFSTAMAAVLAGHVKISFLDSLPDFVGNLANLLGDPADASEQRRDEKCLHGEDVHRCLRSSGGVLDRD